MECSDSVGDREDRSNGWVMKRYNLAVLGTSETDWTRFEQKGVISREMLLESGHKDEGESIILVYLVNIMSFYMMWAGKQEALTNFGSNF